MDIQRSCREAKIIMYKIFFSRLTLALLMSLLFCRLNAQNGNWSSVKIMFYNVENLFDIYDDTLKDDNDFLPGGVMHWNFYRYDKKINGLYKTIVAAGEFSPPPIISFCEVESRKVLEDLVNKTYLSKYGYDIVHEDSPDRRGIDVCMIYRSDLVKIIDYKYWIPKVIMEKNFSSRSILYVKIEIDNDTLNLFFNHWPSRRGGVLSGEKLRILIASTIRNKVDSLIQSNNADDKIIIMGDFNCTPDSREIRALLASDEKDNILMNISGNLAEEGNGTYRYRGNWEMIDQVIVSKGLLADSKGLYTDKESLTIFRPDFLLVRDQKYPGFTPFSTYRGYRYQGGFSDHLPILLTLKIRAPDQWE
jgi:hypothetical protein